MVEEEAKGLIMSMSKKMNVVDYMMGQLKQDRIGSLPKAELSKFDLAEYLQALAPNYEPYKIVQIENLSGEYNSSPALEVRILFKQKV